MFKVDKEMLNDEALQEQAKRALYDIANILRSSEKVDLVTTTMAAFLLRKVSSYNDPMSISYEALLSADFYGDLDGHYMLPSIFSEETWQKLLPLIRKYTPEAFAVAVLINSAQQDMGRYQGEIETPLSIAKLAASILNIEDGDTVADLCCGCGSFLTYAALGEAGASFAGYEITTGTKLIADCRTSLVSDKIVIHLQDVFDIVNGDSIPAYSKVFSHYPFMSSPRLHGEAQKYLENLRANNPEISRVTSSDWLFNSLICDLLLPGGKAVAIMTNGSTWNTSSLAMRKQFVDNGLIEAVVNLPPRVFFGSGVGTSLIVLSNGNKGVRLVDASNRGQLGRRFTELSEKDLAAILSDLSGDSETSRLITREELQKNEYTLSLGRYLENGTKIRDGVPFETVIKSITRGAPCTAKELDEMNSELPTDMQYLMLANIQDGVIQEDLPYLSRIESRYEKYCLKDGDLILSKNGYPYKVAVAQVRGDRKILANGNLYIVELDREKVSPYFLKAFFESEQGIAALKSITVGATIPNIGVDKLKKLEIPLPPMEEQERIAARYQSVMDEIAIYKLKLEKALDKLRNVFAQESEG